MGEMGWTTIEGMRGFLRDSALRRSILAASPSAPASLGDWIRNGVERASPFPSASLRPPIITVLPHPFDAEVKRDAIRGMDQARNPPTPGGMIALIRRSRISHRFAIQRGVFFRVQMMSTG
jgi:hypothetical protein